MKHIKLFYKNGIIKELFEQEAERRIRAEYSARKEKEILRNMLTDTSAAVAYIERINAIKAEVKAEIEEALGFSVDVGYTPDTNAESLPQRVDELTEALTMLLEGVTE